MCFKAHTFNKVKGVIKIYNSSVNHGEEITSRLVFPLPRSRCCTQDILLYTLFINGYVCKKIGCTMLRNQEESLNMCVYFNQEENVFARLCMC